MSPVVNSNGKYQSQSIRFKSQYFNSFIFGRAELLAQLAAEAWLKQEMTHEPHKIGASRSGIVWVKFKWY
jgi:hypothetical protein